MKQLSKQQTQQISGGLVQFMEIGQGSGMQYRIALLGPNDTFEFGTPSANYYFLHSGTINVFSMSNGSTTRMDDSQYSSYVQNGAMIFEVSPSVLS